MKTKQRYLLEEFVNYCEKHPGERFWQALRNWSEAEKIAYYYLDGEFNDTFYWEEINK